MPTLRDIVTRIESVTKIKKITNAMRLVAAAKMTKAQERARTVRPYAEELDGILGTLAALSSGDSEGETPITMSFSDEGPGLETIRESLFGDTESVKPALVLVTSDRGLCGSFNTNLIRAAQRFIEEHPETSLVTLGKKGHVYFQIRKIESVLHMEGIDDKLNIDEIRGITGRLTEMYVTGEVDSVVFVYAKYRRGTMYDVKTQQFLPIPPVEGSEGGDTFILEPSRDQVFETLIPLYATTAVFSMFADSFASEHGARMAAMQQATKNAEEKVDDLTVLRNRMRQAQITKELAEIVGGAEALK
jgi:F-type H+-transporting ATPase subunit gamma